MIDLHHGTRVHIPPFSRQPQGGEVVVGRPETGVYLAMPQEAVDLLDLLAAGKTIGEVEEIFRTQHGETPDLQDFLGLLEKKGLARLHAEPTEALSISATAAPSQPPRYHFQNIPQQVAKRIFSRPVLAACGLLIAMALVAIALDPALVPGRNVLYFQVHRSFNTLALMLIGCSAVFLHELAHLLAARARGVSSRLAISHRLWIVVAETDLTGLWSVPKGERYLPILAGPLLDLVSVSFLTLMLFGNRRGWLYLAPAAIRLGQAVYFGYLMRLLWQFYFFVRTDVYYLITTFFDCKNLLKDSEAFLRNQLARLIPRRHVIDQSSIPAAERRVIRAYSAVWLLGRGIAFGVLFLVTLPVAVKYLFGVASTFRLGFHGNAYPFLDSLFFTGLSLAPLIAGLSLWGRSLWSSSRRIQ